MSEGLIVGVAVAGATILFCLYVIRCAAVDARAEAHERRLRANDRVADLIVWEERGWHLDPRPRLSSPSLTRVDARER